MTDALIIRDDWAARINACWRETAQSIIETGRLLNEAKEALDHGQWGEMLSALEFDERTAQRLMSIGRDQRLSNPAILPLLPGAMDQDSQTPQA